MAKKDTVNLSELIKILTDVMALSGDVPVYLATDSECNSFGTVDECGIFVVNNHAIISPYEEGIEELDDEDEENNNEK